MKFMPEIISDEVKMNYLHVPAIHKPHVYKFGDDIILQYESSVNEKI